MTTLFPPRIIGHRGARATAPENTLVGLRQARAEGATWVEFDVKLTADGEPILIHDETVDRTTDGKGEVRALTLAEIRTLDAGGWMAPRFRGERIPTLGEALDLLAELDMGFNLEIKPCPGREAETARVSVATVRARWPRSRPVPVISSFKADALAAAREAAPELPRGYLAEVLAPDWLAAARRLDCHTVHPGWTKLTRAQVLEAKGVGLPILAWTVNDAAKAREFLDWGVDSLITDRPAALAAELAATQ